MPEWERWEMTKTTLSQHEAVCEQRYTEINRRLSNLEDKVEAIQNSIDGFKDWYIKQTLRSGIGVIITLILSVYFIKFH